MEKIQDENQVEKTEAQKQLELVQVTERNECWDALMDVLKKYDYQFLPSVNFNPLTGVGFRIDITKNKPKAE